MALQWRWWGAIPSRYWNWELEFKLRKVGGGGMGGVEAKRPLAMSGGSMDVLGGVSLVGFLRKSSRIMPLKQPALLFEASSLARVFWRLLRFMSFHTSSMVWKMNSFKRRREDGKGEEKEELKEENRLNRGFCWQW